MLIYQILVAGAVWVLCGHLLLNLLVFRRPTGTDPDASTVSVLVPAHNEAGCIGTCLESLIRQQAQITEILVLDDHSEDATREIIESIGARDPRVLCLAGQTLPEGWTGKAWACHQLSQAATGDVLIFTDADTVHQPECVASVLSTVLRRNIDMISLWPYQRTETTSEKLVIPFGLS